VILQALRELAIAENLVGDPDFEYKPVSWRINLRKDGTLNTIEDLRVNVNEGTKRKPKYEGKPVPVPRQPIRTSGALAFFLVDKAEYVLGVDPSGKRPAEQLNERASLFRDSVRRCAEASRDEAARAVARFLDAIAGDRSLLDSALQECKASPNELFAFRVGPDTEFVHRRPPVVEYWKRLREQGPPATVDAPFQCLITGEPLAEVGLFPLIKRLPGGTSSGVALVSHNARSFESYGLSGSDNAPISRAAAEQAATALNRLLSPNYPDPGRPGAVLGKRLVRLSGNTVVCFWMPRPRAESVALLDDLPDLLAGEDEGTVHEVYRSIRQGKEIDLGDPVYRAPIPAPHAIRQGKEIDLGDPGAFYAITLSGTQGRAIVRDWLETSLSDVVEKLAIHFRDLAIVRHVRPAKDGAPSPAVPLRWLMAALAAEGRTERVPESLEAAFIRSAFTGAVYPLQLLQRALVRARVETGRGDWTDAARRDARAALLKAVLNRRRRFDPRIAERYQEVTAEMNPSYESPGYALGLLMAVLERLQSLALGEVNASIVDRYFAAASATPRVVFVRLLKGAKHHARKVRGAEKDAEKATGFRCEKLIDCIADRFEVDVKRYPPRAAGLPAHLDLEQQGLFVLGYHQMRYWLWMNNEERSQWEAQHPKSSPAFRWLKQPAENPPAEPAAAP
jgi:CRISPR-associated protein Csd1